MGLGTFWCYAWWLTLGAFGSWMLWWLLDRLFLRDTETPARLAAAEGEIAFLNDSETRRLTEIGSLNGLVKQSSAEIAGLKSEVEAEQANRAALEKAYETEYNKVVAEHDRQGRQLAESTQQLAGLKTDMDKKLAAAAAQIAAFESQGVAAARLSGDVEQARASIAARESDIERLKAELASASGQSGEITRLKDALAALEAKAAAELAEARTAATAHTDEIARIKREWSVASDHSANAAKLALDLEARDGRIRRFETETEELKSVLLDSRNALERKASEIARLKSELAAAAGKGEAATRLESDLAASGERVRRLEADLEKSQSGDQRLRAELAAANARVSNLERMREALEAARRAAEGHASEVARLNRELFESMSTGNEPKGGNS